jgi:hypothetical protein
VPICDWFRYAAALSGLALVANWFVLLVLEAVTTQRWIPNVHSLDQGIVLAVVFASYLIGWRHELIGATLALGGVLVFFAVGFASVGTTPPFAAAWFAAPGVLYLLAWITRRDHRFELGA